MLAEAVPSEDLPPDQTGYVRASSSLATSKTAEMNQAHKATGEVLPMESRSHALTTPETPVPPHLQRHFHVNELAELWGMSSNTVRRWFEEEPDVLKISVGYRRGKEHRVCLRIPESVAERVHRKRCKAEV